MTELAGADAKIDRAAEHAQTLKREVRKFFDGNAYRVVHKVNPERTDHVFRLKITKPIPDERFALLIGDCVHNLRSALDHPTWQLAEAFSGPEPDDTATEFPIFTSRKKFKRGGTRKIERLSPSAQAVIKWLQPYRAANPTDNLLAILQNLDISDKHKMLTVTFALLQESELPITVPPHTRVRHHMTMDVGAPQRDTDIATVRILSTDPPGRAPKVKVKFKPSFGIAFGEGTPLAGDPVIESLDDLIRRVRSIVTFAERHYDRLAGRRPEPMVFIENGV